MAVNRRPPVALHRRGCPMCGGDAPGRATWHRECVAAYRVLAWPQATREAVYRRDAGKCKSCGAAETFRAKSPPGPFRESVNIEGGRAARYCPIDYYPTWHVDHIVPLWVVDRDAPDALDYWRLPNLQTLCDDCHKAKSKREAAERAKMKRIQKQGGLLRAKVSKRDQARARWQERQAQA